MRTTYPYSLTTAPDPVGPQNDATIRESILRAGLIICGWGRTGALRGRSAEVLHLIRSSGKQPHALKLNKDGSPQHPLYLPYGLEPFPF
jgi:hypothetical protein